MESAACRLGFRLGLGICAMAKTWSSSQRITSASTVALDAVLTWLLEGTNITGPGRRTHPVSGMKTKKKKGGMTLFSTSRAIPLFGKSVGLNFYVLKFSCSCRRLWYKIHGAMMKSRKTVDKARRLCRADAKP